MRPIQPTPGPGQASSRGWSCCPGFPSAQARCEQPGERSWSTAVKRQQPPLPAEAGQAVIHDRLHGTCKALPVLECGCAALEFVSIAPAQPYHPPRALRPAQRLAAPPSVAFIGTEQPSAPSTTPADCAMARPVTSVWSAAAAAALVCCLLLAAPAALAVPTPPEPCGTLDLTSPLTQHCFPEDGKCMLRSRGSGHSALAPRLSLLVSCSVRLSAGSLCACSPAAVGIEGRSKSAHNGCAATSTDPPAVPQAASCLCELSLGPFLAASFC